MITSQREPISQRSRNTSLGGTVHPVKELKVLFPLLTSLPWALARERVLVSALFTGNMNWKNPAVGEVMGSVRGLIPTEETVGSQLSSLILHFIDEECEVLIQGYIASLWLRWIVKVNRCNNRVVLVCVFDALTSWGFDNPGETALPRANHA